MAEAPRLMMHWFADGSFEWGAEAGVKVICIDDRAPDDRIYESRGRLSTEEFDAELNDAIVRGAPPTKE